MLTVASFPMSSGPPSNVIMYLCIILLIQYNKKARYRTRYGTAVSLHAGSLEYYVNKQSRGTPGLLIAVLRYIILHSYCDYR